MRLGTSSLIVAAFIGPGTVLTCASAGLNYSYALAWVLLFATVGVFVLQSFTAGTGILAGKGLGEALKETAQTPLIKGITYTLVILGLWIGCASFESGNLAGASAGLQSMLGLAPENGRWITLIITVLAFGLLSTSLNMLVRVLAVLVVFMSVLFVAAAMIAPVSWSDLFTGLTLPSIPEGSMVSVIALIGTTIVTYNLFLHPSASKAYWKEVPPKEAWRNEMKGMAIFIPLGGLVSLAVMISGAALAGQADSTGSVGAFATLLEPVAGPMARYFFGMGLFAAGLTSAITAPLAAAAGIRELFDWEVDSRPYRLIWISVLLTGLLFNFSGLSPLNIIIAAQAANGILLPLIAGFVLYLTLRQEAVKIPRWYALLGVLITLICAVLGVRTLLWVYQQIAG